MGFCFKRWCNKLEVTKKFLDVYCAECNYGDMSLSSACRLSQILVYPELASGHTSLSHMNKGKKPQIQQVNQQQKYNVEFK